MQWEKILPKPLVKKAYRSRSELAWPKEDALSVINILQESGYLIIGVDIWLATENGPTIPTPFVYDWDLSAQESDNSQNSTAEEFIASFQWDPSDTSHGGRPLTSTF